MTKTARRRWSRDFDSEVDGIAMNATGPVLVHLYDPPAGDRWIDSAIPGKLAALDRGSGEVLWTSPCEVGYGRGFGAGFGRKNDAVVLGPSTQGHRIVRMSLESGELVAAGAVPTFDASLVAPDLCVVLGIKRLTAYDSETLREIWHYGREGERYHHVARSGDRLYVVYSVIATKKRGVLVLSAAKGRLLGLMVAPKQTAIHDVTADERGVTVFIDDLEAALPRETLLAYLTQTAHGDVLGRGAALVVFDPAALDESAPLWFEKLALADPDEVGEIATCSDCGKLYLVRAALLEVRDALTGRTLGDWAVPGLDERVGWTVAQGAGLLAEETRVSMFELPA